MRRSVFEHLRLQHAFCLPRVQKKKRATHLDRMSSTLLPPSFALQMLLEDRARELPASEMEACDESTVVLLLCTSEDTMNEFGVHTVASCEATRTCTIFASQL
jgi:hypothetical protein